MLLFQRPVDSVGQAQLRRRLEHVMIWGVVLFVALVIVYLDRRVFAPSFPLAAGMYVFGAVLILTKPRFGLYAVIFFTVVGDEVSSGWWPFVQKGNDSTSILFIAEGVAVTPLEGYLVLTALALLAHVARRTYELPAVPALTGTMIAIWAFVFFGLVYGKLQGGWTWVSVIEARGLVLFPLVFFLAAALIRTTTHMLTILWLVVVALNIDSAITLHWYYRLIDDLEREAVDSLVTHSAATHTNLVVVFTAAIFVTKGVSKGPTILLLPLCILPLTVSVLSERRSGVGALLTGMAVVALVLFFRDRRQFFLLVPPAVLLVAAYTAAAWNVEGPAGFPAQAVKSQLSWSGASSEDQNSDLYRIIENINILHTLRSSPILGIGFGRAFLAPYPLPALNQNFVLADFVTHNSVLWLWMKVGFFGFVTIMTTFARAIALGASTAVRAVDPQRAVLASVAAAFVAMYLSFAYIDIAWDVPSMVVLATMMAIVVRLTEHEDERDPDPGSVPELVS